MVAEPLVRRVVVNVLGVEEGDEDVDVEERDRRH